MALALTLPKQCEKSCAKRVFGHGGPSSTTAVLLGPRAVEFRTQLDEALAKEDIGKLYGLWDRWTIRDLSDLPLDTREHNVVRRRVACMAREKLRNAILNDNLRLDEVLHLADAAEKHWPYAFGVKASLEYKAALHLQQERGEHCKVNEKPLVLPSLQEADETQSTAAGSEPGEDTSADEMAEQVASPSHDVDVQEEASEGDDEEDSDTEEEEEEEEDEDEEADANEEEEREEEQRYGRRARRVSFKEEPTLSA